MAIACGLALMLVLAAADALGDEPAPIERAAELNAEVIELERSGRYTEAIVLAEEELELRREHQGESNPETLRALNNLASLYTRVGDYARAKTLFERVVEAKRGALGGDHPDVAVSLNNLGFLLRRMGEYAASEEAYRDALRIREGHYGYTHVEVARSLANVGRTLLSRGDLAGAEQALEQAREIVGELDDVDPAFQGRLTSILATLYRQRGDLDRAAAMHAEALELKRDALGDAHPSVGRSLLSLAVVHTSRGDLARAQSLAEQARSIFEDAYGREHADVAAAIVRLAAIAEWRGDYDDAVQHYEEALGIRERVLGDGHPMVAATLQNLAQIDRARGDLEQAITRLERALAIERETLGETHPNLAVTMQDVAAIRVERGEPELAAPYLEQALRVMERAYGRDHIAVAGTLETKARLELLRERPERALRDIERAIEIARGVFGDAHRAVARPLVVRSRAHQSMGQLEQAEADARAAIEMLEGQVGGAHSELFDALEQLAHVLEARGRPRDTAEVDALRSRMETVRDARSTTTPDVHVVVIDPRDDAVTFGHESGARRWIDGIAEPLELQYRSVQRYVVEGPASESDVVGVFERVIASAHEQDVVLVVYVGSVSNGEDRSATLSDVGMPARTFIAMVRQLPALRRVVVLDAPGSSTVLHRLDNEATQASGFVDGAREAWFGLDAPTSSTEAHGTLLDAIASGLRGDGNLPSGLGAPSSVVTARELEAWIYRTLPDRDADGAFPHSRFVGEDFGLARALAVDDGQGPSIHLVSPRPASRARVLSTIEPRLTVELEVRDPGGVEEVLVGDLPASHAHGARWIATVSLAPGTNELTLSARDAQGDWSERLVRVRRRAGGEDGATVEDVTGRNFALLIATEDYEQWSDLGNPIHDATALRRVLLETYGYDEVELLENPDRDDVYDALKRWLERDFGPKDQVLIFVAGHGHYEPSLRTGFIVTREVPREKPWLDAISHRDFVQLVDHIPAEHVLVVLDVCFGGSFFEAQKDVRAGTDVYADLADAELIARKLERRTRKWITAGGTEYVWDGGEGGHSPFAWRLLEGLRSVEDSDQRVVTLARLMTHLERAQPGPLSGSFGSDAPGSDFVFVQTGKSTLKRNADPSGDRTTGDGRGQPLPGEVTSTEGGCACRLVTASQPGRPSPNWPWLPWVAIGALLACAARRRDRRAKRADRS